MASRQPENSPFEISPSFNRQRSASYDNFSTLRTRRKSEKSDSDSRSGSPLMPAARQSETLQKINTGKQRNISMHQVFGDLISEQETCIAVFNCAYLKTILRQGKLYITLNFILFHSYFGPKIIIPVSDIKLITACRNLGFPNSIKIDSDSSHFFTSFIFRDRAYDIICSIKDAYDNPRDGKSAQQIMQSLELQPGMPIIDNFIGKKLAEYQFEYEMFGARGLVEPVLILCIICAFVLLVISLKLSLDVRKLAVAPN